MNFRWAYIAICLIAMAGLGIAAYWAVVTGSVVVSGEKVVLSPSSYTIKMNTSSVYTKNVTVSTTSSDPITVEIKVLPADYSTASDWGTDFVAFASPSEVEVSLGNSTKVTIVHYAENEGSYKVKVIAAET